MKNYKVKALFSFEDKEENVMRKVGDIFNCNEERYNYLLKHNAIELIEIETKKEEDKELMKELTEKVEKPKRMPKSKK